MIRCVVTYGGLLLFLLLALAAAAAAAATTTTTTRVFSERQTTHAVRSKRAINVHFNAFTALFSI